MNQFTASQRDLIAFHSMDVEGKTIRITKAQHFEGGKNIAVMLFYFPVSYFSLRPTDRIFKNLDPAEIGVFDSLIQHCRY